MPAPQAPALKPHRADYTLAFEPGGDEWEVEARFDARGRVDLARHRWKPRLPAGSFGALESV